MDSHSKQGTATEAETIQLQLERLARQAKDDALTQTLIQWVLRYRLEQLS